MTKTEYGFLLRQLRERAGLTTKNVADQLGVSENLVSLIERDKRSAGKYLDDLAKIYGITREALDILIDLKGIEVTTEDKFYDIPVDIFLDRMKDIADVLGVKMSRLAVLLKQPASVFSNMRTKNKRVSKRFVEDISKVLGIPAEELVDENLDMLDLLSKYNVTERAHLIGTRAQLLEWAVNERKFVERISNPLESDQYDIDAQLLGEVIKEIDNEKHSKEVRTQELHEIFSSFINSPNIMREDINELLRLIKSDTEQTV